MNYKNLLPLTIAAVVHFARCAMVRCICSVETGLLMWDRVGLAKGHNHQKEFPSPAPHQLHIKSFQHLFSFSDLRSLNKGGDLCGKVMRSLSPYVVPWVSLHHIFFFFSSAYLQRPCHNHLLLIETFGRHLKDSHTTRHAEPTAGEQGWGTDTFGRG